MLETVELRPRSDVDAGGYPGERRFAGGANIARRFCLGERGLDRAGDGDPALAFRVAPRRPHPLGRENRLDPWASRLLGLEFLVAADIINTVAIEPTVRSLIVLAGIVSSRTFLSFPLEGRWPWQKAASAKSSADD